MLRIITTSRRRARAGWGVLALLLVGLTANFAVRASAKRTPHLTITRVIIGEAGQTQETIFITEAVRGNGSTVSDFLRATDAARFRPLREITNLELAKGYHLDLETQRYSERSMRPETVARESAPVPSDCLQALPGPGSAKCEASNARLFGLTVDRLARQWTEGTDTYRLTALVARDLDWKPLDWQLTRNGVLVERREVTHLVAGEPAADLFRVPAGFQGVASAAEMMEISERARGSMVPASALAGVGRRDLAR